MASILLVDDQEIFPKAFVWLCKQRGHSATHVVKAEEALEKLATSQYDAAIIDASQDIPVRNNRCLSELMAELYPSITRICFTGALGAERDPYLMERYHRIILKPSDMDELLAAIE